MSPHSEAPEVQLSYHRLGTSFRRGGFLDPLRRSKTVRLTANFPCHVDQQSYRAFNWSLRARNCRGGATSITSPLAESAGMDQPLSRSEVLKLPRSQEFAHTSARCATGSRALELTEVRRTSALSEKSRFRQKFCELRESDARYGGIAAPRLNPSREHIAKRDLLRTWL